MKQYLIPFLHLTIVSRRYWYKVLPFRLGECTQITQSDMVGIVTFYIFLCIIKLQLISQYIEVQLSQHFGMA